MEINNQKIAIITGAAKGIGKSIVKLFIEKNYFVYAVDVDKNAGEQFLNEFGKENCSFQNVDITSENYVIELFKTILQNHNKIDVLVNNAGIIKDNLIWNMPLSDFEQIINVNLKGTWIMCKEAAKAMKSQNYGRIINIASRAWLGNPGQSNYSVSKAGIVSLSRVLALELGRYNVMVNTVAPGLIDTPLTQSLDPIVLSKLINAQPTKKMGSPIDVAKVVLFLADEENSFITGQIIYVDGGKSIGAGI